MRKKVSISIILNLALIFSIFGNDMELEIEEGLIVILHSDHTWSYQTVYTPEISDDTSIMLDNGEVIQIRKNNTWFYVKGDRRNTEKLRERSYLGSVYSAGKAQGSDMIKTKQTAIAQASKYLAKQLKAKYKTQNLSVENLVKCIENEGKDIKVNERAKKGLWKIEVSMSLDEEQIQSVIDCAMP